MDDMKQQMQQNFLKYASYVILDRAIPNVVDGLKPVQRRILLTLFNMDDGKLHKVANVVGQTMAYHPHGDAPISEALVNLANKGFLMDRQGNFGNMHTGDPAAASRYIETRLSEMARETLFNPALTETVPSYDGRNQEPVSLPAKIPVLLMQGAEGIAVGMSTRILPHNFQELLEAQIAYLENKPYTLFPDFPTGGIMDASNYDLGRGKVKLRAKISARDDKTIVISEICYGYTTESIMRSIEDAAKKGKIKIESIHDYTAENVEIEIKLPRGQHAHQLIEPLYAFTDCEVTLTPQMLVIKDSLPWEANINEILEYHTERLQEYLKKELEIARDALNGKIFFKTLEQIFIGERLYKKLEEVHLQEKIHTTIAQSLLPYHHLLARVPTQQDQESLLTIPIRRITKFDIEKNKEEIEEARKQVEKIEKELTQIKKVTIQYIKTLIKKYGKLFPRKTQIQTIEEIDKKNIDSRKFKVFFDIPNGFIGTKVNAENWIECTGYDKLLLFYTDGTYQVIPLPEKQFFHSNGKQLLWVGIADKKQIFTVIYRDKNTLYTHAKRFVVDKFILEKSYLFIEDGQLLENFSALPDGSIQLDFKPKSRQKMDSQMILFKDLPIKGVAAKGIRLTNKEVMKIKIIN